MMHGDTPFCCCMVGTAPPCTLAQLCMPAEAGRQVRVWSHKSITLLAELSGANTPGAADPVHAFTQQYLMIAFERLSDFRGCRKCLRWTNLK